MSRETASAPLATTSDAPRKSKTICVEDPALTMVEPDTMTPLQFYDRIFSEASLVPEKRLMLAVLEDAIASFQRAFIQPSSPSSPSSPGLPTSPNAALESGEHEPEEFDVEAWLESDDMSWPFSFASICQALDMEPEFLRNGLRNWRTRAQREGMMGQVYRFPFRRVNGRRHSINAKRERKRVRQVSAG